MVENRHYLSLSAAAKSTGKSKSVLSKALKNGDLSYVSKDANGYKIDPAELFRVFPKSTAANEPKERSRTAAENPQNAFRIKEFELRLEATAKERDFYKDQVEKIETDRDDWKKQAQTLLLQSPMMVQASEIDPAEGSQDIGGGRVGDKREQRPAGEPMAVYALVAVLMLLLLVCGWFFFDIRMS